MKLEVFDFIEEVMSLLEGSRYQLELASKELEDFFDKILSSSTDIYLNSNSRVKSLLSLKEKIIRNNYYKKYDSAEDLLFDLSDLLGVRIECRFIEDESKLYKLLKKTFDKTNENKLSYTMLDERIEINFKDKQPQEQKNGFKIYRLDGIFKYNGWKIRFELQIKSLVNVFWGEIEHKIIYKNNNYILTDKFFSEMMISIKNNLTTIDNQLLLIYEHFEKTNTINPLIRKAQFEKIISKIIYDMFSNKMKSSIGFTVDFKKSCETIVKYLFRSNDIDLIENFDSVLMHMLKRMGDISKSNINFSEPIILEKNIRFDTPFSKIFGSTLLSTMNQDFGCYVFFKILFAIEDFSDQLSLKNFTQFIEFELLNQKGLEILSNYQDFNQVVEFLMKSLAQSIEKSESTQILFEDVLNKINLALSDFMEISYKILETEEIFSDYEELIQLMIDTKIISILNPKIENSSFELLKEKIEKNSLNSNLFSIFSTYIKDLKNPYDFCTSKLIRKLKNLPDEEY